MTAASFRLAKTQALSRVTQNDGEFSRRHVTVLTIALCG